MINIQDIKKDFPIFSRTLNGSTITYLDNAATTHKPVQVVNAEFDYYFNYNANVSRGVYTLAEESTDIYEASREKIARFVGASSNEIVFTANATQALNLICSGWVFKQLTPEDSVVSLISEHHSNFVPLQQVASVAGASFLTLDLNDDLSFSLEKLDALLTAHKIKILSIAHVSNVIGTVFPIKKICDMVHKHGGYVIVDGSQSVGHTKIDVKSLGCDFFAFSGHKMLGPQGIGVLYASSEIMKEIEPITFGGGMIKKVAESESSFKADIQRLEAGTPNVAGAYALSRAAEYLQAIGMENVALHENNLATYAIKELLTIPGLFIIGGLSEQRLGIVSFAIEGVHSHDVASVLNAKNICVRSGQHCAMPLHDKMNISSSIRASFYIYNDTKDVDLLVNALKYAKEILVK